MRVIDVIKPLFEGKIAPRDFYERYRLVNFIKKLQDKDPFFTVDGKQVVINASASEIRYLKSQLSSCFASTDPKERAKPDVDMPKEIGGVKLSSLMKTQEFGGKVGMSKSGEMDYSKANLGPTVEALKSFAIYAKLVNRTTDQISVQDVLNVGKLADSHSTEEAMGASKTPTTLAVYAKEVFDINKKVKDQITLKVALSTPSFKRAVNCSPSDKAAWGNLQGIIKYVNTESDIGKYSRYFYKDNKRDPLKISVVGISGAKTDIESVYVDNDGKEKPIKNLSMSVKSAGAEWYDQASAGNEAGMAKFYGIIGLSEEDAEAAIEASKFKGGGKESSDTAFKQRIKAVNKLYEYTWKHLKTKINALNDKGEADYIHRFLGKLRHSLAGETNLVYVKFDANGTYEKLKPHLLKDLAHVINLDVNYSPMTKDSNAKLFWIDSVTGETLIYCKLLINAPNKRLTHQFNLGKDFFKLLKKAEEARIDKIRTPGPDAPQPGFEPKKSTAPALEPKQRLQPEPKSANYITPVSNTATPEIEPEQV